MKKLFNFQSSFLSINSAWQEKNSYNIDWNSHSGDKSLKNFSSNSINFHRFKSKANDFCHKKTMIKGKEVAYIEKFQQNFHPEHKSYIKLHISSVTLCDLFSFIPFIPTYWRQHKPLSCSEFAEPNYLFKRYVYIVAYIGIMLQASWHIPEGN